MTDLLTELEEDIREERIYTLWHKWGNTVIGVALTIVLVTGGHTLWRYLKTQDQEKSSFSFSQGQELIRQGKKEEALKVFQNLAQHNDGYGKLAQLYEAALLEGSESLYTQISERNATDPALSNLPKLLSAAHSLDNPALLDDLETLSAPHNAWAPLALELLAVANLKKGDEAKAAENYIKALRESALTPDEKTRISMMLAQIDIPLSLLETLRDKDSQ